MRFVRFLLVSAVVLSSLFLLAGYLAQETAFRGRLGRQVKSHRATMERHLATFLDDQKALAPLDVFQINNEGKDAGALLNPIVRWGTGAQEGARHLAGGEGGPISVPPAVEKALAGDPRRVFDTASQFDFSPFNLSWMKDALAFDYWDIFEAAPVRAVFETARAGRMHPTEYLTRAPLPELKDLHLLAKVRLMKGIHERNPLPALTEVRHLAKLFYSTEALYAALMAVVLLQTERAAYEHAVSRQLLSPGDWTPLSAEQSQRLARAVMGAWGYFSPLTTPEIFQKTYGSGQVAVGRCAGIREGMTWFSSIMPHLSAHFPLERDLRDVVDSLRSVATDERNGCRLKDLRVYLDDPSPFHVWKADFAHALPSLAKGGETTWVAAHLVAYPFPYFRKASALAIAVTGGPTAFRRYDKAAGQDD